MSAAVIAATFLLSHSASAEQDELANRLGAVLGQERRSLDVVPSARMNALTAPPAAALRNVPTVPEDAVTSETALAAMPAATGDAQWECLTEALYFEARGESLRGIVAVGEVILNRVDSASYPTTVCQVVNQGAGNRYACQFSYACDGNSLAMNETGAHDRVSKVARLLLDGAPRELTAGATHFHTRAVNPAWASRFPRTASIGAHHFYRQPVQTASN